MYSRLTSEFLGTMMLVLTVYLTVAQSKAFAGLAIGTVLAIMIYAGGHISGAHYNPAVTFGLFLSQRAKLDMGFLNTTMYIFTQLCGGLTGAAIGYAIVPDQVFAPTAGARGIGPAFMCEVIFTMALVLVVLNVATAETNGDNHFYGFAIGMTVFAGAISCGAYSSAVFNPAVGTGLIAINAMAGGQVSMLWLYWVAPLLGAALAALLFWVTNGNEYNPVLVKVPKEA